MSYKHVNGPPPWTIRYGEEFWRNQSGSNPATRPSDPLPPGPVNLGEVIGRVSHAVLPEGGRLKSRDRAFTVAFEPDGFRLSPNRFVGETLTGAPGEKEKAPLYERDSTEAKFKTLAVYQGPDEMFAEDWNTGNWSVVGDTVQRQLNDQLGIIEHYETRAEGVEVTWVVTKPLPANEALRINAELTGVKLLGKEEDSFIFGDEGGIPKIKVGKVTLVDGMGTRTDLALSVEGNALGITVPASLLASSSFPIAIDPTVGPAFPLIYPTQTNNQFWPAVAGNGTNYLVAWTDTRDDNVYGNLNDIWGTRVSSVGAVLDPSGIAICTNNANTPRVASCAGNWLVVWHDGRNYGTTLDDIYGARVSSGGTVLDPTGIAICTDQYTQNYPDVAANGTNYLVVWEDDRIWHSGSSDIYGARVTTGGSVLDANSFQIYAASGALEYLPRVACDGLDFVVVWYDLDVWTPHDGVWGIRVNNNNHAPVGSVISVRSHASYPGIAWSSNATNYLITYAETVSGFGQLSGNRLSKTGSLLDGSGFAVRSGLGFLPGANAVACNGSDYLCVWGYSIGGIYGARVRASDATVLDSGGFTISSKGSYEAFPAVGNVGTNYLVAWNQDSEADYDHEDGDYNYNIYGAIVSGNGSVPLIIPLSTDGTISSSAQEIAMAAGSGDYFVAWRDSRNGNSDIYGTDISAAGLVQQPSGIAICVTNGTQSYPAVAAIGSQYFAVWLDARSGAVGTYGSRISSGTVVDTNGFLIVSTTNSRPDVGACGTNYLVAWGNNDDVFGKRVSNTGTVLDSTAITICSATGIQAYPSISSINTNWLVAWDDARSGTSDIYANRVTSGGAVLDGNGFAIVAVVDKNEQSPRVASNGTNYMVVWHDYRNATNSTQRNDIYGARVSAAGSVLDTSGIAICTATDYQYLPVVASDATGFLVAWTQTGGLYANRVNGAGTVLDSNGFLVDSSATVGSTPFGRAAIASSGSNSYMVSYRRSSTAFASTVTTP